MVGSGKMSEGANPGEMTGLVQPVALATSTIPQVENEQVSFIVEYRSDLNDGLKEGFWLNEFGVFANDSDAGEVLLYYATMGDYPQYVSAFTGGSVDIRRYPVSIALSESPEVHLDYLAGALVTAEEMEEALNKQGVPAGGIEGQMLIKASNQDYATEWGPWPSNPNLLLNWDFRNPVNRNGKSEYSGIGLTIDKWQQGGNTKLTIGEDLIRYYKNNASGNPVFLQIFNNYTTYNDVLVTLSFIYRTNNLQNNDFRVAIRTPHSTAQLFLYPPASATWTMFTKTIQANLTDLWLCQILAAASGNSYIDFVAVKLEIGNKQTLAHKVEDDTQGYAGWVLNDSPNFDLQYSLCSQYSPVTGEFIGSQHSNPNLLDNWYFADPINQRGQTEYINTVASHFQIIDRWAVNNLAHVSLQNGGMSFRKMGTYGTILSTSIENCPPAGETITLSALCKVNGGTFLLAFQDNAYNIVSIPITEEYTLVSITKKISGKLQWLGFRDISASNDSNNIHIKAAKLEIGDKQTLAHQDTEGNWVLNDPLPNKALELAKCQRYQNMIANGSLQFIGTGTTVTSTDTIYLYISVPVTMRVNPKIEFSNLSVFYGSSNTKIAVVSVENVFHTSNSIRLVLKTATPVPANTVYQIGIIGTDSGNLLLNANL